MTAVSLMKSCNFTIIPIQAHHNNSIARIIQQVGAEYGAVGDGFGPSDAEVLAMSQHYVVAERSLYLVATIDGKVVGGAGIAPFLDLQDVCELKKLFLLPESRGLGIGKALTIACLDFASSQGYKQCYLDTLSAMQAAIRLYESVGFEHMDEPWPGTLHGGCDVWMVKELPISN